MKHAKQNTLSAAERCQWFDGAACRAAGRLNMALQSQGIFTDDS
ncbi:hypothetical protein ACNKHW_03050 [Shigella flexneri]